MEYFIIFIAIIITIILCWIYKRFLNPQVIYIPQPSDFSQCPDSWKWNSGTKKCEPSYQTFCLPFDPTLTTTASDKCKVALHCGTNWSGMCS